MRRGRLGQHLLVLGGSTVLTVALTYPVAFRLATHLPGDDTDTNVFAWNLWWFRRAVVELRASPFWTDRLFAPEGVSLALHSLVPFNGLLGIALQPLLGLVATLNVLVLLGFVLSGYGGWLLIRHLARDPRAAFLGGIIFAFCPYKFAHLLGHLDLVSTQWIPFYILALIRLVEGEGGHGVGRAVACAGCLLLIALCAYPYLAFALIFTAVFLAHRRWAAGAQGFGPGAGRRLALAAILFAVASAPLLGIVALHLIREGAAAAGGGGAAAVFQADLLAWITPSPLHPLWGSLVQPIAGRFAGNVAEATVFAGYLPLALGAAAVARLRRREPWVRFWGLALLAFFVLALGPFPRLLGYGVRFLPLPYHGIMAMPILDALRVPSRFAIMVMLCLAVLAAFACRGLLAALRSGMARAAAFAGIVLVGVVEYLAVPFPTVAAQAPPIYRRMAQEPGDFAVLEVPLGRRDGLRKGPGEFPARFMYYQSLHGKRLIGGYISRAPEAALRGPQDRPLLRRVLELQGADGALGPGGPAPPELMADLAALDIRYIVFHPPYHRRRVRAWVGTSLPVEKVFEEGGVVAFRVAARLPRLGQGGGR